MHCTTAMSFNAERCGSRNPGRIGSDFGVPSFMALRSWFGGCPKPGSLPHPNNRFSIRIRPLSQNLSPIAQKKAATRVSGQQLGHRWATMPGQSPQGAFTIPPTGSCHLPSVQLGYGPGGEIFQRICNSLKGARRRIIDGFPVPVSVPASAARWDWFVRRPAVTAAVRALPRREPGRPFAALDAFPPRTRSVDCSRGGRL